MGAARRLHLSQPAVSKHIAALEREIGVALVIRRPSFQLTPAGQFLADYIVRADALLDQAERGVRALVDGRGRHVPRRRVRNSRHVPRPAGRAPVHRAPAVRRRGLPARDIRRDARRPRSPRGRARHHRRLRRGCELDVEPILDDEIVLVAAPSLRRSRLRPSELNDLLWVHREEGSATRVALEAALRAIGAVPRRRLALPSWEAIKLVVADGGAVAAISRLAIEVERSAGSLVRSRSAGGASVDRSASLDTPAFR